MKNLLFTLITCLLLPVTINFAQEPKIILPNGRYLLVTISDPSKEHPLRAESIVTAFGTLKADSETQFTFSPRQQLANGHEKIVLILDGSEYTFQALWYQQDAPTKIRSIGGASITFAENNTPNGCEATFTEIGGDGSPSGKTFCRLVYLD